MSNIDRDFVSMLESELDHWPGVTYAVERNKHNRIHLSHNGQRRFVVVAVTASDYRAHRNNITYVRRVLREMGVEHRT